MPAPARSPATAPPVSRPQRLLTFAPMVDSETTRLLCRWYGVAWREDDHLFGWVSLLTLLHGGYGRVPLLHGKGFALSGPRAVAEHYEPLAPTERRLLATAAAGQIEADWQSFNGAFAVDIAVFAYFHLLPARKLMSPIFAGAVPRGEARLTPVVYPLLRGAFTLLLGLTAERAEVAGTRILAAFAEVDRRLADGRRYLCGDALTLGDIAFAGAAAPLLQPAGYGTRMPPPAAMPPAIRDLVGQLRRHAAAAHVDAVYAAL